jgi:hypothetical protein
MEFPPNLVSTVGWDPASMSKGISLTTPKSITDPMYGQANGRSMLENWSSLHGWTGVGIEIDQNLLPALVVTSTMNGCSAHKCGAILPGDQVPSSTPSKIKVFATLRVGPCPFDHFTLCQIVAIDGRQDLLNVSNADSMLNGR